MIELESSLHLFQPPLYRGAQGTWKKSFVDTLYDCPSKLTWDISAILPILSFGYPCGDRTLVNEIRRRPWLSSIGPDNEPYFENIPKHGRLWLSPSEIADTLLELLCEEAIEVCRNKREIYILLSGGLDSRVVAGVLARLRDGGDIDVAPIGVTWGSEDSRDVYYGRMAAEILGFKWLHLKIGPEHLEENIEKGAISIACLASPAHLHRMQWFENASKDALVLAASYGDSVGRAEFSGCHLLELNYLKPVDIYGLLNKDVFESAYNELTGDLKRLHQRSLGEPKYVQCEHERQGHYMRNMMGHIMSIINNYCSVYQMFTHPKVYSFMWSVHPALRDNRIYSSLLEKLDARLARMPWARTNRALCGRTIGDKSGLRKKFAQYQYWTGSVLFDRIKQYVDPKWYEDTGIFNGDRISRLTEEVYRTRDKESAYGSFPCEKWLWLASFRLMAEYLEDKGKSVALDNQKTKSLKSPVGLSLKRREIFVRRILSHSFYFTKAAKICRKYFRIITKRPKIYTLKKKAIQKYPPLKSR